MFKKIKYVWELLLVAVLFLFLWNGIGIVTAVIYAWLAGSQRFGLEWVVLAPLILTAVGIKFSMDTRGALTQGRIYQNGHWTTWAIVGWLLLPIELNWLSKFCIWQGLISTGELIFGWRYDALWLALLIAATVVAAVKVTPRFKNS